jgi:hypothetical protein
LIALRFKADDKEATDSSPGGLLETPVGLTASEAELRLPADLQTLRQIVDGLDRMEERLNVSPIPKAITQRGYFTPDEDDRVRQRTEDRVPH